MEQVIPQKIEFSITTAVRTINTSNNRRLKKTA
jgi:hypothetical protein